MNTPVSFELSKLLKEKGYNKNVRQRWCIVENIDGDTSPFCQYDCGLYNWNNGSYPEYTSAPTIAEVVMWLYEKHKIWITSEPCIVHNGITNIYKIFKDDYLDTISRASKGYDSPTEAYEASIEYTLNNLI